ncbi:MAG: PAS/PAC sensor hybrid histidine kinase, partial [bacterium]
SIQIFTNISKELWTISADTTQMHQILLNLSVNARDAMPKGGSITISAENILIDDSYAAIYPEAKAGQYIVVAVKDIGTGIAEDILDKIFEPFFSTKQIGEGTGLGLATVKNIIKSHNGFLSLKSKVGEGTEFKVYLPASKENLAEIPDEPFIDDELSGNTKQVLVVEDEASIREITKTSLDAYNYKVLTANDGIEAIALYAQYKDEIDVILLDIAMPIMDGATALPALYRLNPKVKVIVVTGFGTTYTLENLSVYGVRVILKKPYTTKQLLTTLKAIISGS